MKRTHNFTSFMAVMALITSASCANTPVPPAASVSSAPFAVMPDGTPVNVHTLRNRNGIETRVIDYGGIILSLRVPDRNGTLDDVVLGYDSLGHYLAASPYFGALIGRYGNRIARGRFALDGQTYMLATNNGPNHLHGGERGFDKVVWSAEPFSREGEAGVVFSYTSPDGEEGYPGTLQAQVTYTLTDQDQLIFDYTASADRPTPVNLTQHSYFNLAGSARRDILDHVVTINASRFTPVDATLIPTGELRSVAGTPFDFRTPTAIGARIGVDDEQLRHGLGYDHNFVLDREPNGGGLVLAARVKDPGSGRIMEIHTTEPGLQFYSGNFLDGSNRGKGGAVYHHRFGFAMETQHFPDSPNQASFPSTILRPGEQYHSRSIYTFSAEP